MRTVGWQEKHPKSKAQEMREKAIAINLNNFRRRVALERLAEKRKN